jgi:hypothetical protein
MRWAFDFVALEISVAEFDFFVAANVADRIYLTSVETRHA